MKKTLGRILSIVMVVALALSLSACFGKKSVAEFVKEDGKEMEAEIVKALGGQGECEVKADGKKLVITVKTSAFDAIPASQRGMLQQGIEQQKASYEEMVKDAKKDISDIQAIVFEFCTSKGELCAKLDLPVD